MLLIAFNGYVISAEEIEEKEDAIEENIENREEMENESSIEEMPSDDIGVYEIARACTPLSVWRTRKLTGYLDGQGFYISRFTHSETNETGFCAEPGVNFNICDGSYSISVISGSSNEKIGKIFHAFKKLGASDDLYVAAQFMIWDALGYHYTLNGDTGYAYGRTLLENYIKNNFKPSKLELPEIVEAKIGEEIRIPDTTGNLSKRYKVSAEGLDDVRIEENELVFTMNDKGPKTKTIKILPKVAYKSIIAASSLLYYSPTSQNVYSFSGSFPIEYLPYEIKVQIKTGNLEVHKYDEWGNPVKERIEVEIYDENDALVESQKGLFIENGILKLEGILSPGNYYLKELPTRNYVHNDKSHEFSIIEDEWTMLEIVNQNNDIDISYRKIDNEGNDIAGAKFELYDLGQSGEEVRFLKLGSEYVFSDLFEEGSILSERYERYHQDEIFKPMELGIVNYQNNGNSGHYYVSNDEYLTDVYSFDARKIFEGESYHNYIRTVDRDNHNEAIPKEIKIYSEDDILIETVTTNTNGLYDISHYEDGYYYYLQDGYRYDVSKQSGINTINNLKSDRNYLLCERQPANGYQYEGEACKLINTYDYDNGIHEFINGNRTVKVKVVKESNEGILLNNALFEIEMIFPDGQSFSYQQISGGIVIENKGFDISIKGEEDRYIQSSDNRTIITDLAQGHYSYKLIDGTSDEVSFDIEKGSFSIVDIPFGTTLSIKEIKAPSGYQLDEEVKTISPDLSYDELTFRLSRINSLLIIPPEYKVPILCTLG